VLVKGYGNYAVAFHVPWASSMQPMLIVVMAFPLQALVGYRCIVFLKMRWFVAVTYILGLTFVVIVGFVYGIEIAVYPYNVPNPPPVKTAISAPVWLIASAVYDITTTATLYVYLRQSRAHSASRDLNVLLNRVVRVIWETATPPALCQTITLLLHFLAHATNPKYHLDLWTISFMMICGQLYVLSYFITLNFRLDVQETNALPRTVELKLSNLTHPTLPTSGRPNNDIRVNIETFKETDSTDPESTTDITRSVNSNFDPISFSKVGTDHDMHI